MRDPAFLNRFVFVLLMTGIVFSRGQSAFSKEHRPLSEASTRQTGNQISGHVFDDSRRPVPQMSVELMNDVYQTIARTRTDSSGFYVFGHLSSGHFSRVEGGTLKTRHVRDAVAQGYHRGQKIELAFHISLPQKREQSDYGISRPLHLLNPFLA